MSLALAPPLVTREIHVAEITLSGVVSLSDSGALHRTLKQLLQQGCRTLVVDLLKVVDIDQSCWSRLVSAARQMRRKGGHIILRHCPERLFHQLQACNWDRCFLAPDHRPEDRALLPDELLGWGSPAPEEVVNAGQRRE